MLYTTTYSGRRYKYVNIEWSVEAYLTAESTWALAVVGVSIQGTVCTSPVACVFLTMMTVVVTQTWLCSRQHTTVTQLCIRLETIGS